ncbi:MAG: hypothetical protein EOP34_11860 [Rickettsiales bacterium]|nr:MAG: hypothetical protein EOP34_11860 [Rickettsiales bacterium]
MAFYMAYHGRDMLLKELLSDMSLTELRSKDELGQTNYIEHIPDLYKILALSSIFIAILYQIMENVYLEVFKAIIRRESDLDKEYYEKGQQ